jgi:hypothetical protein
MDGQEPRNLAGNTPVTWAFLLTVLTWVETWVETIVNNLGSRLAAVIDARLERFVARLPDLVRAAVRDAFRDQMKEQQKVSSPSQDASTPSHEHSNIKQQATTHRNYTRVKVVLLSWQNSDLRTRRRYAGSKLGRQRHVYRCMEDDVHMAGQAFQRYNYDVEHLMLPNIHVGPYFDEDDNLIEFEGEEDQEEPLEALVAKLEKVKEEVDDDTLVIIYYGGHGRGGVTPGRLDLHALVDCLDASQFEPFMLTDHSTASEMSPEMQWRDIYKYLLTLPCDTLIFLHCDRAGSAELEDWQFNFPPPQEHVLTFPGADQRFRKEVIASSDINTDSWFGLECSFGPVVSRVLDMHRTAGSQPLDSRSLRRGMVDEIKKHHNRMEHAAGHPINVQPVRGTFVAGRDAIASGATQPTHFCLLPGHQKGIRLVPLPDPIPL